MKKKIVIGLLGTTLDQGFTAKRWNKWRPSVAVCQQENLIVSQYHLLYPRSHLNLARKIKEDILLVSPETEVTLQNIEFENPWDFEEVYGTFLDFSEEFPFHPEEAEYLMHITTGTHVAQICMFLLTESRHFPGKLLQSSPVHTPPQAPKVDRTKGTCTIIDLDLAKYDRLAMRFARRRLDDISFLKSGIQTRNTAFNSLIERIETVAIRSRDPLLITGPTGAGKSELARRIFELKKLHKQVQGNFVEVNCATLRGDSAMSVLFGHKQGAFTGAIRNRAGLLKTADRGICFLDEIGELGQDEQAMLLQAVEKKTFLPLGADHADTSDFQLICGTNRDLKKAVNQGLFREDLLARINLWTFRLPGLRERPEDIEPNLDYELSRFAGATGRKISFSREAREHFLSFATSGKATWEANFRDLNGAVRRMATLAEGGRITESLVREEILRLLTLWAKGPSTESGSLVSGVLSPTHREDIDLFDRLCLEEVLKVCSASSSLSEAGRTLYNVSRTRKRNDNDADRLAKYLKRFNLHWSDVSP